MTLVRTDVHRPSAIEPADYDYVAFECVPKSGDLLGDCGFQLAERAKIRTHFECTGGTYSQHAHGGNCMVCGNANAIYTVLFHHRPSNTYVRMGQDCAEKVDAQYPRDMFVSFKRTAEEERRARAGKAKARRFLEDRSLAAAWAVWEASGPSPSDDHFTVKDVVSKLVRYGSISEKQVGFLRFLLRKIADRPQVEARRAAEREAAAPVPVTDARVLVEGEVVSVKVVDGNYGRQTKILVKADAGWKVYGTCPSVLLGVERGERVRFTAAVTPSRDDPKFGFFSRPVAGEEPQAAPAPSVDADAAIPF